MPITAPVDHNLAHIVPLDTLTIEELLATVARPPASPRSVDTQTLSVGGVPVAVVTTDPSHLNPITATSSAGMPALEMLAALAGHDPTGLIVIERPTRDAGYAFALEKGRVTGARAPGPLGDVTDWCEMLRARFPEREGVPSRNATSGDPQWVDFVVDFIREQALDALEASAEPGTRISLLRGDVTWTGNAIPNESAPGLQHLLLEQARRQDELPRMLGKLGDLHQLALPMYEPGPLPPGGKPTAMGPADSWGDARPDCATSESWERARALYPLCDGQRSIAEIIEDGMYGRFRTLESLIMLAKGQSVIVVESPKSSGKSSGAPVEEIDDDSTGQLLELPRRRQPLPPPDPERPTTGYALNQRATDSGTRPCPPKPNTKPRRIPTRTRVEAHHDIVTPMPPSVRNENVGGGHTLLNALEAEIAALDEQASQEAQTRPAPNTGVPPWQYAALILTGSVLFAGGVLFSSLFG